MADKNADLPSDSDEAPTKKSSKAGLLIALFLSLALGGGGFFATYSGAIALPSALVGEKTQAKAEKKEAYREDAFSDIAYVALDELIIPLSPNARARFLAFQANIEVAKADVAAFEALRPRIIDIFNTYLRAVEESDLESPSATTKLRAQLLRRIRVVAAPVEPRDLLISSFILK